MTGVWDRLDELVTPYTLAVNLPYALALAFVAGEVAWLARRPGPGRRAILRSAGTATTMALGALAVGVVYTWALRWLWGGVAAVGWQGGAAFWRAHPVVGAVAAFVAWDAAGWAYHVVGHRTRIGWAAHRPHHTGEGYDATLGLRQTWAPFHGLAVHPLVALLGFDLRVVVVCAAVSNCWQVLEHTSLPVRFPRWVAAVVMTPAAHRHHHGRDGGAVNLGPFLTVWDRLAGTWVPADHPPPAAYGPAVPAPANPVAVELAGWAELARRFGQGTRDRACRKRATWTARAAAASTEPDSTCLPSASTRNGIERSASSTTTTVHRRRATGSPAPARRAQTHPRTNTATTAAQKKSTMASSRASVPPSIEIASARITGGTVADGHRAVQRRHPRRRRPVM